MRIKLKRHECRDPGRREVPRFRVDPVAAAVLRHSRIPGKSHGRCGKRPYHASGGVVRCRRKAGGDGKRWVGRRVDLGKGGQKVGKWTGFSHFETPLTHLFPHDSTQVVDFPRIEHGRLFWGGAENSRSSGRGMIGRGMAKRSLDPIWGRAKPQRHKGTEPSRPSSQKLGRGFECGFMREKVRIVTRCYAKVHESSHRSGPWLRDVTHCYG